MGAVLNLLRGLLSKQQATAAEQAPIKSPATNVAMGSIFIAALTGVGLSFNDVFKNVFGVTPGESPTTARAVFIAVVVALAVVLAADLIARAIASRPADLTNLAPMPEGWKASVTTAGADETGYIVAAQRISASGLEYLLVKEGKAPAWKTQAQITLQPPAS
jgi:hypothetical protein